MSDERFRRDLNNVFDDVAGSTSANLRDRVRSGITSAPEARAPYWIAAVAAAVIAILIVGVLVVGGPLRRFTPPVGVAHSTPSPSASQTIPPKASAFLCGAGREFMFDGGPSTAYVSAVDPESLSGYDRVTIEFANGPPSDIQVGTATRGTTFTLSPSGLTATLKGDHEIQVTLRGADLHTSYSGSTDIVTGSSTVAEIRRVQDFEGVVQIGLGVIGSGCYRAYWLDGPERLVIDVQASS